MWRIPIGIVFILVIIACIAVVAAQVKRKRGLLDELMDLEEQNEALKKRRPTERRKAQEPPRP